MSAQPSPTTRVLTPGTEAKKSLVVIGAILILLFIGGVAATRLLGNESEETSSPAATGTTATTEVTKKTKTKNFASDSLLTTVLVTGAVLIVVGLLYSRLSVVKLPGGAEISLKPEEKEKIAEMVAEKAEAEGLPPAETSKLTTAAIDRALEKKQVLAASALPETQINEAVVEAATEQQPA